MQRLTQWLISVASTERGQDMVEYAMVVITISIPIVLIAAAISPSFATWAEGVASTVSDADPRS